MRAWLRTTRTAKGERNTQRSHRLDAGWHPVGCPDQEGYGNCRSCGSRTIHNHLENPAGPQSAQPPVADSACHGSFYSVAHCGCPGGDRRTFGVLMSNILWLLLGWVLGIFTVLILDLAFRGLVTGWHLVTRPKEDRGSVRYELEKSWNLARLRQFFRVPGPKTDTFWPAEAVRGNPGGGKGEPKRPSWP